MSTGFAKKNLGRWTPDQKLDWKQASLYSGLPLSTYPGEPITIPIFHKKGGKWCNLTD